MQRIPVDIYLAALQGEVAAEAAAPLELLGHVVVGLVPAGVLHQRHRDAAVDGVLGVGPRHRLVLEQPLLPVRERGALLALVLQLGPRQLVAAEVPLVVLCKAPSVPQPVVQSRRRPHGLSM